MTLKATTEATLTHVSVMGERRWGKSTQTVFTAVILPGKPNVHRLDGRDESQCNIVSNETVMNRLRGAANKSGLALTVESLADGNYEGHFLTLSPLRAILAWLKPVFDDAVFSNPRYWLSQQQGRNTNPVIYIDDIEGTGDELEVRQHLTAEEGQPEIEHFSHDIWQMFAASLIESGLFQPDGVQLHLDDSTFYLELRPRVEATISGMEELTVAIAKMLPPQPVRRKRHRLPRGSR